MAPLYPLQMRGRVNPVLHKKWEMEKVEGREKKLLVMASPKKQRNPGKKWVREDKTEKWEGKSDVAEMQQEKRGELSHWRSLKWL